MEKPYITYIIKGRTYKNLPEFSGRLFFHINYIKENRRKINDIQ